MTITVPRVAAAAPPFEGCEPDPSALSTAVRAELDVDDFELDAEALAARMLRLRVEHDRLAVAIARADHAFEASRAFRRLPGDATKASKWLAANGRIDHRAAKAAFRFARRLAVLPTVMAAVVGGVMSVWQARRLCAAASTPARLRNLRRRQLFFLDQAEQLSAHEFRIAIEHWKEVNFGDEIAEAAERADANRRVHCSKTYDGIRRLDGNLHPVWGALFATELDRITDELFRADWARAEAEHGDDTTLHHLWRTPAQRRHDALIVMALRANSAGPAASAQRPLVSVLVDWKTLHGRLCELADGTHLAVDEVLRLLGLAEVERAVWGPDDRITVSERSRVFRGAQRRAVELRDRFCTAAGCEVPAERCDVDHHPVPADQGGPTDQDNGRLRCPDDHAGRRRHPDRRPLPFEHRLDELTDPTPADDPDAALAADFARWRAELDDGTDTG